MAMLSAREVRERLKGRVDPQVSYVLEALAEQQKQLSMDMSSVGELVNRMADIVASSVAVAENMKAHLDRTKSIGAEDDQGAVTK